MMRYDYRELMRTGRVVPMRQDPKTADEIFRDVKLKRCHLISAHNITDGELRELIRKIKSGTRNTMYLARGADYARLHDMAAFIVREYSYE
jgi:hypothetical protein